MSPLSLMDRHFFLRQNQRAISGFCTLIIVFTKQYNIKKCCQSHPQPLMSFNCGAKSMKQVMRGHTSLLSKTIHFLHFRHSIFSRVHATPHPALSVGPLVRRSVGPLVCLTLFLLLLVLFAHSMAF